MAKTASGADNSDNLFWVLLMIMALMFGIMYLFQEFYWLINAILGSLAWAHVYPLAMLGEFVPALQSIPLLGTHLIGPCVDVNNALSQGGFSEMTFAGPGSSRAWVMGIAGRVAFLIYTPALFRAAFLDTDILIDHKYRRRHSLESMLNEQAKSFPTIRLFKHLNPIEQKDLMPQNFAAAAVRQIHATKGGTGDLISGSHVMIRPGGFTRSINPEEWLLANGLVMNEKLFNKMNAGKFPANERDYYFPKEWEKLSLASIQEILEGQLVTAWKGAKALPIHMQALFSVMTLYYGYDRKAADAMIDNLGILAEKAHLSGKTMDEMIKADPVLMKRIEDVIGSKSGSQMEAIAAKHAWVESALPSLLRAARFERGVFASASFLWLKKENRSHWYILNATGNETVNIEAAGAMAHNRAEIDFDSPLYVPQVYQAARSILHDYLNCHPDQIAKRHKSQEETRTIVEQLDLMAQDYRNGEAS